MWDGGICEGGCEWDGGICEGGACTCGTCIIGVPQTCGAGDSMFGGSGMSIGECCELLLMINWKK